MKAKSLEQQRPRKSPIIPILLEGIAGLLLLLWSGYATLHTPPHISMRPEQIQTGSQTFHGKWTIESEQALILMDYSTLQQSDQSILLKFVQAKDDADRTWTWNTIRRLFQRHKPYRLTVDWTFKADKNKYGWQGATTLELREGRSMFYRVAADTRIRDKTPQAVNVLVNKEESIALPARIMLATMGRQTFTIDICH